MLPCVHEQDDDDEDNEDDDEGEDSARNVMARWMEMANAGVDRTLGSVAGATLQIRELLPP